MNRKPPKEQKQNTAESNRGAETALPGLEQQPTGIQNLGSLPALPPRGWCPQHLTMARWLPQGQEFHSQLSFPRMKGREGPGHRPLHGSGRPRNFPLNLAGGGSSFWPELGPVASRAVRNSGEVWMRSLGLEASATAVLGCSCFPHNQHLSAEGGRPRQ